MKGEKLSRFTKGEIPLRAGRVSDTSHVLGMSQRRGKLTEMPGTNARHVPGELGGMGMKRRRGGLSHDTAPFKHEMAMFGPGEGEPV